MGTLLLESGDDLLLESGSDLLLEGDDETPVVTGDAGYVVVVVASNTTGTAGHQRASDYFDVGDRPVFTATFKYTITNELGDPTAVSFLWKDVAGAESTYVYGTDDEVTRASLGVFMFVAPVVTAPGVHCVRTKGTAGLIAAAESRVAVRTSFFTTP